MFIPGCILACPQGRKEIDSLNLVKAVLLTTVISLFLLSCAIEESPIDYGKDACHFCKMNIVDKQHAAEIVTKKGKAIKYDAIECMMADIKERNEADIGLFLMTDYSSPGKLVDAVSAYYIISENLPSPMGANLTGFANIDTAESTLREKGGTLYTWDQLKALF
jgi:copper chaperone NosL